MGPRIENVTADLLKLSAQVKKRFGRLSPQQLNWKPTETSWSIGQCLDHLITTHNLYFPTLQKLGRGNYRPSLWARYSPLSGFFGRALIKAMQPDNLNKMKTAPKAEASTSAIDPQIVEQFCEHQEQLVEHLRNFPTDMDFAKTMMTSPLLGIVTYTVDECLTIFVIHGQRHFGQAQRVMKADGFPA